ncbi:cytochrome P450 [Profundibacterium mesophilum]|uniref:Fatty acid beta hydroxylase n=1 Tax=Profundibacterium mesophilum KAUST100406-0324 TaxID=1037889 RepID=A0A921TEC0_9RHOB|nr:cytochrome P450 [Profundibacterium mesophilum]KAF0677157.1 putative fatty acid beta hydroxylase [Profundibacterium mesophilum KAUST100406-0324]
MQSETISGSPPAKAGDSTLALLRDPYGFIANTCRDLGGDLFETRILLHRTICMTGASAAELFYREDRLVRAGAMPARIRKTLLGDGGVQHLDGHAHRHRKRMFMTLMGSERIAELRRISLGLLDVYARQWERTGAVILYDEVREILTRAVCTWAGVPLPETDVRIRTAQLTALFQDAGAVGWSHWRARRSRRLAERWATGIIEQVRGGDLKPPEECALHVIATWRDPDGEMLSPQIAAVELLNVLRPTVAVSVFIVQAAHAMHRYPDWARKLKEDDRVLEPFVQEVRRFYPFFPAVAARVHQGFSWRGYRFEEGRRVLLDLHGTNTDPRSWTAPHDFRPERFQDWHGDPYTFIPQGGGRHGTNHRCPGEWIAISQMEAFCGYLATSLDYDVPEQNTALDPKELPPLPADRVVLSNVRRSASLP